MDKKYGADLKKELLQAQRKLDNVQANIKKRFDMYLDQYSKYIVQQDKDYLMNHSLHDLSLEQKCDIMARADEEYIRINSNQLDMFN